MHQPVQRKMQAAFSTQGAHCAHILPYFAFINPIINC